MTIIFTSTYVIWKADKVSYFNNLWSNCHDPFKKVSRSIQRNFLFDPSNLDTVLPFEFIDASTGGGKRRNQISMNDTDYHVRKDRLESIGGCSTAWLEFPGWNMWGLERLWGDAWIRIGRHFQATSTATERSGAWAFAVVRELVTSLSETSSSR